MTRLHNTSYGRLSQSLLAKHAVCHAQGICVMMCAAVIDTDDMSASRRCFCEHGGDGEALR